MPGLAAEKSGFSLALQPELLAGGDARGDLDRELPLLRDAAGAAARRARLADDLAVAAALRAGARDGEEALLEPDLALPAALGTLRRRRARRRARPLTRVAVLLTGNLDRGLDPARGFLEADLEIVTKVRAALGSA